MLVGPAWVGVVLALMRDEQLRNTGKHPDRERAGLLAELQILPYGEARENVAGFGNVAESLPRRLMRL